MIEKIKSFEPEQPHNIPIHKNVDSIGFPETENKEVLKIKEKIARAFLHQSYPLTSSGLGLRLRTEEILKKMNADDLLKLDLPTVENPRLELFAGLELTPDQKEEILGTNLADIQVTKGCRHQCLFCAAGAEKNVRSMPFPAILKIAEEMRLTETKKDNLIQKFENDFKKISESVLLKLESIEDPNDENRAVDIFDSSEMKNLFQEMINTIEQDNKIKAEHPELSFDYTGEYDEIGISNDLRDLIGADRKFLPNARELKSIIELEYARLKRLIKGRPTITNYYDSDPFDYFDTSFLHDDGTPADYGDVVEVLTPIDPRKRNIHITTAGWYRGNETAKRAIKKFDEKELFGKIDGFRLSVTEFEVKSRKDPESYFEDMKEVIKSLKKTNAQILFNYERNEDGSAKNIEFIEKVVRPLQKFIDEEYNVDPHVKNATYVESSPSYFSGRFESDEKKAASKDVMSCMPGFHIHPDGNVYLQGSYRGNITVNLSGSPKGTRPQSIEIQGYKLNENV